MIDQIIALGNDIEKSWSANIDFSTLAYNSLVSFENTLDLEDFEDQTSQWILKGDLPKQLNVYDGFGQPPVTIFNNGKFVIDLYFWMNIDTSIHSHAFSGAFKVLYGTSVHEKYSIIPKNKFYNDIMTTDFKTTSIKVLKANDCHRIKSESDFNHRLIHLDTPTITLCVRTIGDDKKSQWHHYPNGLSVEKKELSQELLKSLYFYNYLFKSNEMTGHEFLVTLMEKQSRATLLNLYEKLTMDSMGLEIGAIQTFFDLFLNEFSETPWFKLYEDFYLTLEKNYIELEGDSPEIRFLEHALIFRYPKNQASEILTQIQDAPLNVDQLKLLEVL